VYRALWTAQFVSNIGTWMQTVGAQWLMGDIHPGALNVALVQAATTLPVFLLGFPAGAFGDVFDRRRLLLASQGFMLVAATLLAVLTAEGLITPWLLLALTFAIGAGQAVNRPSWQAIQPEIVGRELIPQASALGGVSINLARSVGPAIGGVLVAASGPEAVFALNAVSFVAVLLVIWRWHRPERESPLGSEHIGDALRSGARYARSSPRLRAVLARGTLFIVFASALWALLPVTARDDLHLGASGYGLMLGALGVGAVGGAALLPRVRARFSENAMVAAATVAYAAVCAVIAWVHVEAIVLAVLLVAGFAWIVVLSSLNATAQAVLPDWVRSRGLSLYLIVFAGGQSLGALLWGVFAQRTSTPAAFTAVAIGMAVTAMPAMRAFRLRPTAGLDMRPSRHWSEPDMALDPAPTRGPVLITIDYRVPPENADEFREAMRPVGRARRRTGAQRWSLWQDGSDPERFLETYIVPTWEQHQRQHHERFTLTDRMFEDRARALLREGTTPKAEHLLFAYED
jgi:MFS family permease